MDVSDWRERINKADRRILDLLNERVGYVLRLAPLKRQGNIPVHEPRREEEVLSKLREQNDGPLSDEAVCRIFEAVMKEMQAVQMGNEHQGKRLTRVTRNRPSTLLNLTKARTSRTRPGRQTVADRDRSSCRSKP